MSLRRIAAIPIICLGKGKYRLVLITKRRHKDWIVPCGKLEATLSDKHVAALEAFEEAGVVGKLESLQDLPEITLRSHKGNRRKIKLYGLRVNKTLQHWPEREQRKRRLIKPRDLARFKMKKPLRRAIQQYLDTL